MADLGISVQGTGVEDSGCADLGTFLFGHFTGFFDLSNGDMFGDPPYIVGPGEGGSVTRWRKGLQRRNHCNDRMVFGISPCWRNP